MLLTALWTALLFAISAAANPVQFDKWFVTLGLSRRLNLTSAHNLVRHDQARAKYLKNKATGFGADAPAPKSGTSQTIDNQAVSYVATVSVGSPATDYSLLVDTGSSNTWIGAAKKYNIKYGSGSVEGPEYIDTITITPSLVIPKQSIGAANTATGFSGGIDGILGIGPVDLTLGTLFPAELAEVPTVTDNLFKHGLINTETIGISFEPTTEDEDVNGEITWGGTDNAKYTGEIAFFPITSTSPASNYWGIDQSIRYGASNIILPETAGIVDTGTTLILIATDGFGAYKTATGAVPDNDTGLLAITPGQYSKLESLFFMAGGTTFELTPHAQIWPRSLNGDIGGTADNIYLIVGDLGSDSGQGLDFINGFTFLERFYSVYDTSNKRVGLATTSFTNAKTN